MSPISHNDLTPYLTERKRCCLCPQEFSISDHTTALRESGLEKIQRQYGDLALTAMRVFCPDCLKKKPKIKRTTEDKLLVSHRDLTKGLYYFFLGLVFITFFALLYSLTKKRFNLPNFPFAWYIGIHIVIVLMSFTFEYFRTNIKALFESFSGVAKSLSIVLLMSFLVPSFRHIFYSYFPTMTSKVAITFVFVIAVYLEKYLIEISLLRLFSRYRSFLLNLFTSYAAIIILLSFLSPFYLGVIKMSSSSGTGVIKAEAVDKIYEKELTSKTADEAIARRYFNDGKQSAGKGTRAGFLDSIQLFKMALELKPTFSTAYAEMAYSYTSIAKLIEIADNDRKKIEVNYKNAREAVEHGQNLNQQNPTLLAVDLLNEYIKAQFYLSHKAEYKLTTDEIHTWLSKIDWAEGEGLNKLMELSKKEGVTDKVLLAEAMLTEDRIRKGSLLLTIIEKIDADNAVVHNLLGLVYYLVNDKDSAKKILERAKRLSPDFSKPYINLALVSSKKEVRALYKEGSLKDKDSSIIANYYTNLFLIMRVLQWFLFGLVITLAVGSVVISQICLPKTNQGDVDFEAFENNFTEIKKKAQKASSKFSMAINSTLIVTYGIFELYIHFIQPINGIDHMFPVKYPFF